MRRVVLGFVLVAAMVWPSGAHADTAQCPDGYRKKVELTEEQSSITFRRSSYHCFKYGTETSGVVWTRKHVAWSTPNGLAISYYVCYGDTYPASA